ncbi:hypothetical protein Y032_0052g2201 [Ancylostoma ceylanicum]|uniref:Uncharacterized protein n=1 Tax=Ancylostoma ceylanicum TaxID=53326 RepID=A0A016U851_9BILA|nr:hypothetical protein Y032_0052g2201 [Ancylostoma ceylanicum]
MDRLPDCTITAERERGIWREHALSGRVEQVPPRFCSRDANKPHTQSVYLFDEDGNCNNESLELELY